MDLKTNTLIVASKHCLTYETAQLTNAVTNKVALKIELSKANNTMSLENIQPGKYLLILTNSAGNIQTDELFIF